MSGLVRIPWATLCDLAIPPASVKQHSLNDDMCWIDRRCIQRYIRRAMKESLAWGPLRAYRVLSLNALKRHVVRAEVRDFSTAQIRRVKMYYSAGRLA